MQRELCRLAHRANEQANTNHRQQRPRGTRQSQWRQRLGLGEHFCVVQAAGEGGNEPDTQNKTEIAHAVHQKGLHVGEDGGRLVEPETNQQVGHQPDRLPAEKQLQEIVAHHQHQHRKGKQRDVGKEAVVALILFHVTDGVDVHHERYKGHHAHHHGRQAIHQKTDLHLQAAHGHPRVDRLVETRTFGDHAVQGHRRQNKGHQHAQNGHAVGGAASDPVTTQPGAQYAGQQGTAQRSQGDSQQYCGGQGLAHLLSP